MPRIISNSIISSSDNREEAQGLHSYYCLCSEFILVIDMEIGQLARRATDNAAVIENATRMYKLHAIPGEVKVVRRGDKFEKQHRLYCPRCSLLIAYETTPHLKSGLYTYIVQGSLNEIQGVPHDDWELELPGHKQPGEREPHGEQDENMNEDQDKNQDEDSEMKLRMKGNQDAAARARALLTGSGSAP
ncbi:hypothetical protein B0O80DRAFT_444935 [Mortierella sp. GBAus27b]|nr:hypothetical protein B0O80DRAFT_444935 [Mortierella sp. GBAus27b]